MERIAALPMYDFPELRDAHDAFWSALSRRLIEAGVEETPPRLTRHMDHFDTWRHPSLLFGQGCEYPLAEYFAESIRLVATPRYTAPGCDGTTYRSAIVVHAESPAASLEDLRHGRCAVNEITSNSGMNLLRASIAPLANGARFFGSVLFSGSHRKSVDMVAGGEADVAAVDCVSLAHFRRFDPSAASRLRVLDWTPASPSLPFITAAATDDTTLQILRSSLAAVLADPRLDSIRDLLFLEGAGLEPDPSFTQVLRVKHRATESGYAVLC